MTINDINNLPKEFDFKSHINNLNLVYHAKEEGDKYIVTTDGSMWDFSKEELHSRLLKNDFYIVNETIIEDKIEEVINNILDVGFDFITTDRLRQELKEFADFIKEKT